MKTLAAILAFLSATVSVAAANPDYDSKLESLGFNKAEIKAVHESVDISKWLAVKSFVDEANLDQTAPDDIMRRESHGKGQACLRAKVSVTADGPGVFKKGEQYPAWIRLSNGGNYQADDRARHISRGFGVKLLGVDGTETGTHDFLFITSPRFFIEDITHYPSFLRASGNGRFGFLMNVLTKMSWNEKKVIFHRLSLKVSNLLESPEYSAVAYRYGNVPAKYALAPCDLKTVPATPQSSPPADDAGPDYLTDSMDKTLRESKPASGICYAFYIQKQRDENLDPVDNPTKAWTGPFERVGTIEIPYGQHRGGKFDFRKNDAECERMAFDPFNTTVESTPLGKTNWTRKLVYAELAKFRREEFPAIYQKYLANPNDETIPREYGNELARLMDPKKLSPPVQDANEPKIDENFRALGIEWSK